MKLPKAGTELKLNLTKAFWVSCPVWNVRATINSVLVFRNSRFEKFEASKGVGVLIILPDTKTILSDFTNDLKLIYKSFF